MVFTFSVAVFLIDILLSKMNLFHKYWNLVTENSMDKSNTEFQLANQKCERLIFTSEKTSYVKSAEQTMKFHKWQINALAHAPSLNTLRAVFWNQKYGRKKI